MGVDLASSLSGFACVGESFCGCVLVNGSVSSVVKYILCAAFDQNPVLSAIPHLPFNRPDFELKGHFFLVFM